jgi:CRP-like cAMP-binding protein
MLSANANEQHHAQQVPAGTVLVFENEVSRKMYVIKRGQAKVFKQYLGQRITLAVLGPGEIFGEMGFVDAQPRSASVEALTDMEVVVIDGAKGTDQFENIPPWVWAVFRTVFHRFRELDNEIISLRCALNYRKKGLKQDVAASTIYLELVRYIKALELVCANRAQAKTSMKLVEVYTELDGVVGNRTLGLKQFWKLMQEFDMFDPEVVRQSESVRLMEDRLKAFDAYLKSEIEKERYLILSHGALSVVRKMIHRLDEGKAQAGDGSRSVSQEKLGLNGVADVETALKELEKTQVIPFKEGVFDIDSKRVHDVFVFQSIVKAFDHTSIFVD